MKANFWKAEKPINYNVNKGEWGVDGGCTLSVEGWLAYAMMEHNFVIVAHDDDSCKKMYVYHWTSLRDYAIYQ